MTAERRRQLLLGLLVVLLLALGLQQLWRYVDVAAPRAAAPAKAAPGAKATAKGAASEEVVELRLADLEVTPFEFVVGRDPFRFGELPPPPPPPPPTKAELEALERARLAAQESARVAAIEAAKPRPPAVDLIFLGSFGPPTGRFAVFSRQGREEVFNAREGEVIDNKFIVDGIGLESVSLKFVGFPQAPAQRLAIGG